MKIFLVILFVNGVQDTEIIGRRSKMIRRNSIRSDVGSENNSESSRGETSGNRTTLTFGEMVGIYHDIWNAMLLGGKTTTLTSRKLHSLCISIKGSCNCRIILKFSALQSRENQQLERIKLWQLRRRASPGGRSRGWSPSFPPYTWGWTRSRPSPPFTRPSRGPSVRGD